MKVLVVHNFHRKGSSSGDDLVFKNESKLLEEYGHDVIRYSVSNDTFDEAGPLRKVLLAAGMVWSFKNYREVKRVIKECNPEVVHVHTFFPILSPSIFYAAKRARCKVVATTHDTRLICPVSSSLRDGQICNLCMDGRYLRMAKYGCFKQSKPLSLVVALVFKYHRLRKSFYNQIDRYICLNEEQRSLLIQTGFDPRKIVKKYNYLPDPKVNDSIGRDIRLPQRFVVFYGRLGEEKGIRNLMRIWDELDEIPLVVMGGGPLQTEFENWASDKEQVTYLGYTEHEKCLSIVRQSEFVVFPSIFYEGCSMVFIETESVSKALVATDLGFSVEAIEQGVNGYKVALNDISGFVDRIRELWVDPEKCVEMGHNARRDYEQKYQPGDNYRQLLTIYQSL